MPYISQSLREAFPRSEPDKLAVMHQLIKDNPGCLNYLITLWARDYIATNGGLKYSVLNAAIGALECAKLELYRRVIAPYEDKKIKENGDVFPSSLLPS